MAPEDYLFVQNSSEQSNVETGTDEQDASESLWNLQEQWPAESAPTEVNQGDIRTGTVVAVQDDGVVVSIGTKYEGIIPMIEFPDKDELPQVDERIEVAVVEVDEDNASIRLSKKRADFIRVWTELETAAAEGTAVNGTVTERVKGGLRVDVGVSGFVPASHVAVRDLRGLERFVGRTVRLKILEADRTTNKVILSHRQFIEEERQRRRQVTLDRLQEGMVCEGKVRSITNYGAFVDLGGIDGLLHVSEMAWGHVRHPSDVVKEGEIIRVVVLKIEQDGSRISLGRRQILPDPWKVAAEKLQVGQTVKAHVTRVVRNGAFAAVEGADVEGFIPQDELVLGRSVKPDRVVSHGKEVEVQVLDLDPKDRKLRLSIAAVEEQSRRQEMQQHARAGEEISQTLGDRFPDLLKQFGGQEAAVESAAEEASEETREEAVEATPEEALEQAAEEAVEEAVEEAAEEASQEAVEETSRDNWGAPRPAKEDEEAASDEQ